MTASSNAIRLIALFGGVAATARKTGLDIAIVSRWQNKSKRSTHGKIHPRYNGQIMKAAKKDGFPAQAKLWLDWKCPECGGQIKDA